MLQKYFVLSILTFLLSSPFASAATIDSNADTVKVQMSCTESGGALINNCFTSMDDLFIWLMTTRNPKPSAAAPLLVEIGPGTFGAFSCIGMSNISLQGSGPDTTTLVGPHAISSSSCTDLSFKDFTAKGTGFAAVTWSNCGNSHWNNVHVIGQGYGWLDDACFSEPRGQHYWFASRISATPKFGFVAGYVSLSNDESWFIGSEISASVTTSGVSRGHALEAAGGSIMHAYGSVLRVTSEPGVTLPDVSVIGLGEGMVAVHATAGASIHLHGTAIDVDSKEPNSIAALMAGDNGHIHANQSSYNLTSPGVITRIATDATGMIKAPYQWERQKDTPPNVQSITGADTYVETDCDSSGSCTGVSAENQQPHMMIYSSNCVTNGPWFDSTTGKCRGVQ